MIFARTIIVEKKTQQNPLSNILFRGFIEVSSTSHKKTGIVNIAVRLWYGKEKKGKAEEVAEKTGEAVGEGIKKGWGITKGIGKGLVKGVKGEEKKRKKK